MNKKNEVKISIIIPDNRKDFIKYIVDNPYLAVRDMESLSEICKHCREKYDCLPELSADEPHCCDCLIEEWFYQFIEK